MRKVLVAVGSSNGVKIRAAREAFEKFFECEVKGVDVKSGVSQQPFGEETFEGAKNRAMNKDGKKSIASSGMFPLPNEALRLVKLGKELGDAMDILTGLRDTKRGPGAIGLLTRGVVNRAELYRDAVIFALVPFINNNYTWQLVHN